MGIDVRARYIIGKKFADELEAEEWAVQYFSGAALDDYFSSHLQMLEECDECEECRAEPWSGYDNRGIVVGFSPCLQDPESTARCWKKAKRLFHEEAAAYLWAQYS